MLIEQKNTEAVPTDQQKHVLSLRFALIAMITIIGTYLRFAMLDEKSLWGDEMNMIWFMTGERDIAKSSGNSLGYLYILRLVSLYSSSDFWFRFPAVLAAIPTIPLLYKTGSLLFNTRIGIIASTLMAISPLHIAQSQQVHAYSTFCFLSLLLLFLFWKAYYTGKKKCWLALAITAGISMHIHLYTCFVLMNLAVLFTLFSILDRQIKRWVALKNISFFLLLAVIFVAISWPLIDDWILPLGIELTKKILGEKPHIASFQRPPTVEINMALFHKTLKNMTVWRSPHQSIVWIALTLFLIGAYHSWTKNKRNSMALLIWVFLPLLPIAYFSRMSNIDYGTRRLIFILPAYLLIIGTGVTGVSDFIQGLIHKKTLPVPRWTFDVACTAIICVIILSTPLHFYYTKQENADIKRFALLLEKEAMRNDLIIAWRPEHYYYYYPGPMKILDVRMDIAHIQYLYQKHDRIWYLRPKTTRGWRHYQPIESWLQEIDALTFNFGGNLIVSFNRRIKKSPAYILNERKQILQSALALKPGKPYLENALRRLEDSHSELLSVSKTTP